MKMSCAHKSIFLWLSVFFLFSLSSSIAEAIVPPSSQFKYVNEPDYFPYIMEYDADYRCMPLAASPFQLCFYNTTSNAFTLAMRMGTRRSTSVRRWVWEANRGNPVRENATLSFGPDGNLVLAEADGKVVWHTNTANKGVVGLQILPNGNMVLHDSTHKTVWQSFDSPTDTLLVGQSLKRGGKLVSRASTTHNVDGPYSFVLESTTISMYYKSPNSPRPLLYFPFYRSTSGPLVSLTFGPDLDFKAEVENPSYSHTFELKRSRYNTTLSFLRLGIDGNLRVYTYDPATDYSAWEVTYTLFSRDYWESECQLPSRCGEFGLCEDDQCVGCPLPSGIQGWTKECKAPKLKSCGESFKFYKVEGVDHFLMKYTRGGTAKLDECGNKCRRDCKCMGYFYNYDTSKCWIAYDLMTLTNVNNSTHVGFIKAPSH